MVFAISCFYRYPPNTRHGCLPHGTQIEALKWCGQSLQALRLALTTGSDQSHETVLLSCILLSALQFQQNNVVNAVPLLRAGFDLACEIVSTGHDISADLDLLIRAMLRQGVLLSIFGCTVSRKQIRICWQYTEESYIHMQNLHSAREYLFTCMLDAVTFINSVAMARYQSDADHYDEVVRIYADQQKDVLGSLARWYRQFMLLTTKLTVSTTVEEQRAISSMMVYYHVSRIWSIACLARSSLVLDEFTQQFSDILVHAENALQPVSPHEQPFIFEMGMIAPLSFVAGHCRQPILRRRAITLIRRASTREALFTAEHSARAAELIVALEETPELRRKVEAGEWDGNLPGQPQRCQYVNEPFEPQVIDQKGPTMHYLQSRYSRTGAQIGWTHHSLALFDGGPLLA